MSEQQTHDSDLRDLLAARPELRLAVPYLNAQAGRAQLALAAIFQQWSQAVYAIEEQHVAASKLRWWADELSAAREGHTHHPLASAVFAHEQAMDLQPTRWREAIEAGLSLREVAAASDFATQFRVAMRFHGLLAKLECELCFGVGAAWERAAQLACVAHLLASLIGLRASRSANDGLPMQLRARHALDQAALTKDTPERRAAIRDQLEALQNALADAMSRDEPLSLASELTAHADRAQIRRALRAEQPLQVLADSRLRVRPAQAFRAWRMGRRL